MSQISSGASLPSVESIALKNRPAAGQGVSDSRKNIAALNRSQSALAHAKEPGDTFSSRSAMVPPGATAPTSNPNAAPARAVSSSSSFLCPQPVVGSRGNASVLKRGASVNAELYSSSLPLHAASSEPLVGPASSMGAIPMAADLSASRIPSSKQSLCTNASGALLAAAPRASVSSSQTVSVPGSLHSRDTTPSSHSMGSSHPGSAMVRL